MNPECLQAQQIISEAHDGSLFAPEELQKAKSHCASCPECAAFVSGLARLREVAAIQPPETVLTATISAVRLEKERLDAERATQAENTPPGISLAAQTGNTADASDQGITPVAAPPVSTRRPNRSTVAWVGAAAAIVLAAMFGTAQGIRYMIGTPTAKTDLPERMAPITQEAIVPPNSSLTSKGEPLQESREFRAAAVTEPRFVVFGGFVYEVAKYPKSRPTEEPTGELRSDLGTGEIRSHKVHAIKGRENITILTEDGNAYEAQLVTRSYRGAKFALQADFLETFGSWPGLPAGFETPASEDGSPSFESAGTDSIGTRIFVPKDKTPAEGFAVAPNPPARDPVAGSPNWTWWAPYNN